MSRRAPHHWMMMMMMMMNGFVHWLTNERDSALFTVGNTVRDSHHCKYPKNYQQNMNSGFPV